MEAVFDERHQLDNILQRAVDSENWLSVIILGFISSQIIKNV